jgi:hypothetical protein
VRIETENGFSRPGSAVQGVHVPGFVIVRDDNKPPASGFD